MTTIVYVTHDQVEAMTMGTRIAVMRDGILQQLDTPQNLYSRPANTFVAGFIGSPAMNFFKVTVAVSNGVARVAGAGFSLELDGEKGKALAPYNGKPVVLGIRPQHLTLASPGQADDYAAMPAAVEVVEMLGSEKLIYFMVDGESYVAQVDANTEARMGDRVTLAYSTKQVHLFDPDTQLSIARTA